MVTANVVLVVSVDVVGGMVMVVGAAVLVFTAGVGFAMVLIVTVSAEILLLLLA